MVPACGVAEASALADCSVDCGVADAWAVADCGVDCGVADACAMADCGADAWAMWHLYLRVRLRPRPQHLFLRLWLLPRLHHLASPWPLQLASPQPSELPLVLAPMSWAATRADSSGTAGSSAARAAAASAAASGGGEALSALMLAKMSN